MVDARPAGVLFWFRHDLRLHDQPALHRAIALAQATGGWLLPLYIHDPLWQTETVWGFARSSALRQQWRDMALHDLRQQLQALGSDLLQWQGEPVSLLRSLALALGEACRAPYAPVLVCEEIAAPEEQAQLEALRKQGLRLESVWQSTLMEPASLPFAMPQLPDVYSDFRRALERASVAAASPLPAPRALPPLPPLPHSVLPSRLGQAGDTVGEAVGDTAGEAMGAAAVADNASSAGSALRLFGGLHGGERAALRHLEQYCQRGLPHSYKQTRNGLSGIDYSTKWSPWLATGALSPRRAWAEVQALVAQQGPSEGTDWIRVELLWRDYFRWLHCKYGRRLYRSSGLRRGSPPTHDAQAFLRWCRGQTGQPFIDAGMRELKATGYLSNRLRQNVASYLIHDLACDWRAGAAWFEAQLIDFDVTSNQGNWLYLSGGGTDPRGSRRFDPQRQAQLYDPDGAYRARWGQFATEDDQR